MEKDNQKSYDNQKRFQVYKGNSKNTGAAASFTFNDQTNEVYLQVIKQTSWSESTKTASFKEGQKKNIKLGPSEIGQILEVINSNGFRVYSTVHRNTHNENKTTSIKFNAYGEGPAGYGFSASSGDDKFSISFTIGEAEVIRLFLSAAVVASFGFASAPVNKKDIPVTLASKEAKKDEGTESDDDFDF